MVGRQELFKENKNKYINFVSARHRYPLLNTYYQIIYQTYKKKRDKMCVHMLIFKDDIYLMKLSWH